LLKQSQSTPMDICCQPMLAQPLGTSARDKITTWACVIDEVIHRCAVTLGMYKILIVNNLDMTMKNEGDRLINSRRARGKDLTIFISELNNGFTVRHCVAS